MPCIRYRDLTSLSLSIVCVYIPSNSPLTVYDDFLNAIETLLRKVNKTDSVLLIGDLNMSHTSWKAVPDSNYLTPIGSSETSANIINCLFESCVSQINSISNGFDKMLNLVFVSDSSEFSVIRCMPIADPEDQHYRHLK